jgi:hypothetical protein
MSQALVKFWYTPISMPYHTVRFAKKTIFAIGMPDLHRDCMYDIWSQDSGWVFIWTHQNTTRMVLLSSKNVHDRSGRGQPDSVSAPSLHHPLVYICDATPDSAALSVGHTLTLQYREEGTKVLVVFHPEGHVVQHVFYECWFGGRWMFCVIDRVICNNDNNDGGLRTHYSYLHVTE